MKENKRRRQENKRRRQSIKARKPVLDANESVGEDVVHQKSNPVRKLTVQSLLQDLKVVKGVYSIESFR